jgi:hypothetical protein
MFEVSYEHDLPTVGSRHRGLTQKLREMYKGGSVDIPLSKRAGVYSAARAAGVKVRTQALDTGVLRVWRADGPARPASIFDGPVLPSTPVVATSASPSAPSEPSPLNTKKTSFN